MDDEHNVVQCSTIQSCGVLVYSRVIEASVVYNCLYVSNRALLTWVNTDNKSLGGATFPITCVLVVK